MAASKEEIENVTVSYMGRDYEVCRPAIVSLRVQRAMANAGRDLAAAFDAMDEVCCGRLDEYASTIPEKDGEVSSHGASTEAVIAFVNAAAEQVADAKN